LAPRAGWAAALLLWAVDAAGAGVGVYEEEVGAVPEAVGAEPAVLLAAGVVYPTGWAVAVEAGALWRGCAARPAVQWLAAARR
jgi:hypothetical protein